MHGAWEREWDAWLRRVSGMLGVGVESVWDERREWVWERERVRIPVGRNIQDREYAAEINNLSLLGRNCTMSTIRVTTWRYLDH